MSYESGDINDEEFLLLWEEFLSENPEFLCEQYPRFSLDDMNEAECLAELRFGKDYIFHLADVLQIPEVVTCYQGTVSSGIEALCISPKKRLAYPCRYSNMIWRFGRPVPFLSVGSSHVLDYIFKLHSHCILSGNHSLLSPAKLQVYSDSIVGKGAALQNCYGFIYGTVRPIYRPAELQRVVDNKR